MLAKIYDALTILLIVCGVLAIALIYLYRDTLFGVEKKAEQKTEHAYLMTSDLKIEPRWLASSSSIRGKKVFIPINTNAAVFASGLNKPISLEIIKDGSTTYVVVVEERTGNIVVLIDSDGNNSADDKRIFASNLNNPRGIDYYGKDLYVGLNSEVVVFKDFLNKLSQNNSEYEVFIRGIPSIQGQGLPIKVFSDYLFVGVSTSCNYCIENDKRRGSLVSYTLDTKQEQIFATGFNKINYIDQVIGALLQTESSVNITSQDSFDELNLVKKDLFYGWPFYINNNQTYSEFSQNYIGNIPPTQPLIAFNTDSRPQGFTYIDYIFGSNSVLLVSLSGEEKVVSIDYNTQQAQPKDFFMFVDKDTMSEFTDVKPYNKSVLITDYSNGIIYNIYPN